MRMLNTKNNTRVNAEWIRGVAHVSFYFSAKQKKHKNDNEDNLITSTPCLRFDNDVTVDYRMHYGTR